MPIAVKIKRNVASSPPPYLWIDEDFYDNEVREVPIFDGDESIVKILGTGRPKIINRPGYGTITITFKLISTNLEASSTLTKLKNLSKYTGDGGQLILYPLYIKEPDFYRIVIMPRGQIPEILGIAGRHSGGRELPVKFLESEKNICAIVEESEI